MRGLGGHTSSQGNRQDRDTQIRNRASGPPSSLLTLSLSLLF